MVYIFILIQSTYTLFPYTHTHTHRRARARARVCVCIRKVKDTNSNVVEGLYGLHIWTVINLFISNAEAQLAQGAGR